MLLALMFAAILVPLAMAEHWLGLAEGVREGVPSPITVRLPDPVSSDLFAEPGRILVRRGDVPDADQASVYRRLFASSRDGNAAVGLFVAFALIGVMLGAHLRSTQRGRLLRVQVTVLASFVLLAALFKAYLLFTPLASFLLPAAALALLLGVVIDRNVGLGGAIALGLVLSAMTPFDVTLAIVFVAQGVAAVLAFARARSQTPRRSFWVSGLAGGGAAAGAYIAITFLLDQRLAFSEALRGGESPLLAAFLGGVLAGPLAIVLRAGVEHLLGEIPKSRLQELADLEHPLLKQIAQKAPGTWQHSLAMANLAETAASAIGANALLVRVGAYYHDLGKSLAPGNFIENMERGQPSPHDALAPEKSADAIFAHVTEGVRVARDKGLPEAVIDFMHMHHGDGVLEYFWGKCLQEGNPRKLGVKNFRYPGVRPQTRETAILAICDAVEAASRSLKQPDARAIEALVQRIVYGKLHLGQLDESGLTVAELKAVADVLVDTLKHAHHIRVEYPWQKEEAKMAAAAEATPAEALATRARPPRRTDTQRVLMHSLDSADQPRPLWSEANGNTPPTAKLDAQPTREMPRPATMPAVPPPPPPKRATAPRPPPPYEEVIEDLEPDPNTPQPWSVKQLESKAAPPAPEAPAEKPPEPEPELFPEEPAAAAPPPQLRVVRTMEVVDDAPKTEPMAAQAEPQPEAEAPPDDARSASGPGSRPDPEPDAPTPQPDMVTPPSGTKPVGKVKLKKKKGAGGSTPPAPPKKKRTPKPFPVPKAEIEALPPTPTLPDPPAAPKEAEVIELPPRVDTVAEVDEAAITTPMRVVRAVAPEEVIPLDMLKSDVLQEDDEATIDRPATEPPNMVALAEPLPGPPKSREVELLAAEELTADELQEIDPAEGAEDVKEPLSEDTVRQRPPMRVRTIGPPPVTRVSTDDEEEDELRTAAMGGEEDEPDPLMQSTLPPRATPPPRRRLPPPPPEPKKPRESGE